MLQHEVELQEELVQRKMRWVSRIVIWVSIWMTFILVVWVIMYNIHCICMYTARVIDWNHR